jgi:murein DD-endopeptidase MepM/ murein hydrolase activator NlpD
VSRLLLPALVAIATTTLGTASLAAAPRRPSQESNGEAPKALAEADCPAATLPDGEACVRLPAEDEGAPETLEVQNAHREKSGRWAVYDQIPRRPDRPADYDLYRYPIPAGMPGGHHVVSGYDLDRPDLAQRRGATLSAVGHGGVDLPQRKGLPIPMMSLEHQEGPADVVYVGPLFGTSVVTLHALREGGELRDYIVIWGHLDAPAPGLKPREELKDGDLVGFVGDTGSPELVHLHLEARRVRDGVDVMKYAGGALLDSEVSVVCDPRNVLPLM